MIKILSSEREDYLKQCKKKTTNNKKKIEISVW
jgi:hypothetical protein